MARSDVWEETHMLPIRLKFQREDNRTVVCQLPGYVLPETTVSGADHDEALAKLIEHVYIYMGKPE